MEAKWRQVTNVKITAFDLEGNVKDVTEIKNLLTTVGLGMVIDVFQGLVADGEIKDMAWGSDDGTILPLAITNTTLGAETSRATMTTQAEASAISLLSMVYLSPATAVGAIEELGWFAGPLADGIGPDTGIMVSRVYYSRNKTALESLQVERTDSIEEVT